ncbi:porin Gram-negative type [Anaeromyxobacter sp. K]|uniref:porin n=1 Tax=Anaeromyxobacter sp. (strain K) TaxID=447217 RepID=UPI00015F8284|nr:porin [Anaeromyxobacter sp. K]ACG73313.1 porin Gram-negative type [Anaeromyxobacter sp. K]
MRQLVSAALFACLVAARPAAAEPPAITIYGKMDVGYAHVQGANGAVPHQTPTDLVESGQLSGSRLGFKATEDLGNGVSALFLVETGVSLDTGSSTSAQFWGRQAYAGLTGAWGKVTVGRHQTPGYWVQCDVDPFEIGTVGNIENLLKRQSRTDNSVQYVTPTFAGLELTALWAQNRAGPETEGNGDDTPGFSGGLRWRYGPVLAAVAYYQDKSKVTDVITRIGNAGATWDLGFLKLHASGGFYRLSDDTVQQSSALAGLTVPVPVLGGSVRASYSQMWEDAADDAGASKVAVGYIRPLAKKTDVYLVFAHIENERNGTKTFDITDAIAKAGGVDGVSAGLRYAF